MEAVILIEAYNWHGNVTRVERRIRRDTTAPQARLTAAPMSVFPGKESLITATYSDNDAVASVVFMCGENVLQLNSDNQYSFIPETPGTYDFTLTVTDKAGNQTVSPILRITAGEDKTAPTVNIQPKELYKNNLYFLTQDFCRQARQKSAVLLA